MCNVCHALLGGGGCGQQHQLQAGALTGSTHRGGLLQRDVGYQQAWRGGGLSRICGAGGVRGGLEGWGPLWGGRERVVRGPRARRRPPAGGFRAPAGLGGGVLGGWGEGGGGWQGAGCWGVGGITWQGGTWQWRPTLSDCRSKKGQWFQALLEMPGRRKKCHAPSPSQRPPQQAS